MPKSFSTKNINKLKIYLASNGNKAVNIKPNDKSDKADWTKPRAD